MSIKAMLRKITGKGGALNRTSDIRTICYLHVIAATKRVSIYDLD